MEGTFREWKTSRCIIGALHAGALAWLAGEDPPSADSLNLPDTRVGRLTAQAFDEQRALGWNVLFRGFWSSSWQAAQEAEYQQSPHREKSNTGPVWAGRAIGWFFSLFEKLWKHRNSLQHGTTPEQQAQIRSDAADRAIRRFYGVSQTLQTLARPFRQPMQTVLDYPLRTKEHWVRTTTWFLPQEIRRQRRRGTDQTAITDFFEVLDPDSLQD